MGAIRRCALGCGEFFLYGIKELLQIERLFERAAGTEQFGDIQKVSVTLRPRNGDDFRVEVLAGQLKRGFQSVRIRHQQIHNDQIDRLLLIDAKPFAAIGGLEHAVPRLFEDFFQKPSDRLFIVDDEDGGHDKFLKTFAILPGRHIPV